MRLFFHLRQLAYDLSSGLLVRPVAIITGLSALALAMPVDAPGAGPHWLFPGEPAAAQLVLSTVASSMMTVVSVVYSILLVALSLTSMQFSTRILQRFVRDGVSQATLGLFIGTFVYCLILLRQVQSTPTPRVPAVGVGVAVLLALGAMGWLVYFIHHIVRNIQANHLVDHIAAESEVVLDAVFARAATPAPTLPDGWREQPARPVVSRASGYVQIVDLDALAAVADAADGVCETCVSVGQFAVEGAVIAVVHAARALSDEEREAVQGAFDLGAARTMQDDAEFGLRQIVDIALKAISPAVNDPSTAATCIDQLSRLLVRIAARPDPQTTYAPGEGRSGRVLHRTTSFAAMVDLAFTQIRQYGRGDMAVGLRLLRALDTVAEVVTSADRRAVLVRHARLVERAMRESFAPEDCRALDARIAELRSALASDAPAGDVAPTRAIP